MSRTFFVGVYPGLDPAQLDYMASVFSRFMSGERVAAPMAVERDADDAEARMSRRQRSSAWRWVYTVALRPERRRRDFAPDSSCTWRSTHTIPAASGRTRACSRLPALRGDASSFGFPTPCGAGSRADGTRARRRPATCGSRCPTATSSSTARGRSCCLQEARALRRSPPSSRRCRRSHESVVLAYGARTPRTADLSRARRALCEPECRRSTVNYFVEAGGSAASDDTVGQLSVDAIWARVRRPLDATSTCLVHRRCCGPFQTTERTRIGNGGDSH